MPTHITANRLEAGSDKLEQDALAEHSWRRRMDQRAPLAAWRDHRTMTAKHGYVDGSAVWV